MAEVFGRKIGLKTAILIGLVIFVLVLLGAFFSSCDGKSDRGDRRPPPPDTPLFCPPSEMQAKIDKWGGTYPYVFETPKGVMVYSGVPVPANALAALDRAADFSIQVQKAQFPEWQKWLTHAEYEVWFVEADGLAPQSKLPFLTRGGVMTAGTVAFCDNTARKQRTPAFLPDFRLVNWEKESDLEEYAFNEWEHSREIQNNLEIAKKFFGSYDKHPHEHEGKPRVEDMRPKTLVGRRTETLACGFGQK